MPRLPIWFLAFAALALPTVPDASGQGSIFEFSLRSAADALDEGKLDDAAVHIRRALERDPKSPDAWALRARWAEAISDRDELVYALHKEYGLLVSQGEKRRALKPKQERLVALDPQAAELFSLRDKFVDRLRSVAEQYEKERRPHSAIRVYQQMLALDPELGDAQAAIERISAQPDPSLAETAKPKDLLEGISQEWIREFDAEHSEWDDRAKMERDNYNTYTDAGYEVLVRSAEAMEQMNAFYRQFFRYGTDEHPGSVPRIDLNIFKNRDEYLTLGIGPPVEWSGGHFTGGAVETYIGDTGFEGMVGTLFHEAAHQFVSLATTAAGWLNEGLASFFEGCRILNNGTVIMNLPANHRLFPLVERLERGWMKSHDDGIDPSNASATPTTAPTLEIIIENKYAWGPPWYAPTWGFVFFLYNYQDPADGRFIYRAAFQEFIDASGGRVGEGAVENFEEVILKNPQRPTKGLPRTEALKLPRTVAELNEVWKEWLIALADEQTGRVVVDKPYYDWAMYAIERRELDVATEHFEKGLVQSPFDIDLLTAFAEHLADRRKNKDRAVKLVMTALRVAESAERVDKRRVRELESMLSKWDPKRSTLARIMEELQERATAIVDGYLDGGLPLMAMAISSRLGNDLDIPGMYDRFEQAARSSGKSISLWQLAYNEENLKGWAAAGTDVWVPYGAELLSRFGDYAEDAYLFNFLTCEKVTSGDFSMELDLYAERGEVNFCGLVFGRKGDQTFHSVILHPGRLASSSKPERGGYLDLTSFFGGGSHEVWRHNPVDTSQRGWHKLRLDVVGSLADIWWDDEYVVTHDFGSVDVLRGSFGLITGPGNARYRNVRFLSYNPRDPTARIERDLRMEGMERESGGGAIGGSYLRKQPPFPTVWTWLQGGRTSFDQLGPVPQLMVFWSIEQNEALPIDRWLKHLAKKYRDVGLSMMLIGAYADADKITEYLTDHTFPGAVAIDRQPVVTGGYGQTFDTYSIGKFSLPRLILLDIDGTVVWEGDPGFEHGIAWKPGMETYLDKPLDDLVKRRDLRSAQRWVKGWQTKGGPALSLGDFDEALPLLKQAAALPRDALPMVGEAQAWMRALVNAAENAEVTAERLRDEGAEAAIPLLIDWAERIDVEIGTREKSAVRRLAQSSNTSAWNKVTSQVVKSRSKMKPGKEWEAVDALIETLDGKQDRFSTELLAELRAAKDARDLESARWSIDQAELLPSRWLVYWLASSA